MPDVLRLGQGEPAPARIAVVGCGGAGCNILQQVPADLGLTRVALNDAPHRSMAGIASRLIIPKESLIGLATMDEIAVKQLSTPEEKSISGAILTHDLVVPLAGLGGETGGPAASLVGRVARILGTPTIALVASPWLPPNHDVLERVVVIVAAPDFEDSLANEVLHEVRLAAPRATVLLGGHVDEGVGERRLRVSILAAW